MTAITRQTSPRADGSPAAPAGRRARRKAETRRRLLEAARQLFVERGYDATRPQDIARLADVAAGTFYLHFPDKPAAFLAFTEQAAEELMEHIRSRLDEAATFEKRFTGALKAIIAYAQRNPGLLRAAFADEAVVAAHPPSGASLRERLASRLAEMLRRAIERGEVRPDYDPEMIAWGIVGMVQQSCGRAWRPADRPRLLDNLTRFCARALVPAPTEAREEARR
ncbi:MAG: TetR/AcrR family transcriptional regulator [Myxococcota bacterium]